MTSELCHNLYLQWLENQVIRGQYHLLELMHQKEFIWFVPHDDNRIVDGKDLRLRFMEENPDCKIDLPFVSFLEVMVALAHRCEFQTGIPVISWNRRFLEHLGLTEMKGRLNRPKREKVDEILERVIYRNYKSSGDGGFFPLAWPEENQTRVELWYQMANYVNESHEM
jgi:hypothetical protein